MLSFLSDFIFQFTGLNFIEFLLLIITIMFIVLCFRVKGGKK